MGHCLGAAAALTGLFGASYRQGKVSKAQAYAEESLAVNEDIGNRLGVGIARHNLGFLAAASDEHTQALGHFRGALGIYQEIEADKIRIINTQRHMADSLLSLDDLEKYQFTRVQLNEIMKDGQYNGVFYYQGVPLRIILESASIEKKVSAFTKRTDLAVVVRNSKGRQVTLSWGEIFYRNPGQYILATSAVPIMPHGGIGIVRQAASM